MITLWPQELVLSSQQAISWSIPAKTFLLGEYAALTGAPAILITTSPCFQLSLRQPPIAKANPPSKTQSIHPASPAGQFIKQYLPQIHQIRWHDPYNATGGLGASSAQFIGAYLAYCHYIGQFPNQEELLQTYYHFAWQGVGLKPSGYDVIAQTQNQCVYINKQKNSLTTYEWSFADLAFLLIHTGNKVATHDHLLEATLPHSSISSLIKITERGKIAFETGNSLALVEAVNAYQQQLSELKLITPQSLEQIELLGSHSDILAIKGCGALGADILLLLLSKADLNEKKAQLQSQAWNIIGSSDNLHRGGKLIA